MSISRQYFKFFLLDTPSGLCFKMDQMGNVVKKNIILKEDLSLPQSPDGWDQIEISFGRNSHYWGMNRTFTIPLKFVGAGAAIIRSVFYTGRGVEAPITLVVLKWNDSTGVFTLYYSGLIDLSKIDDLVSEGVTVNVMEGGAAQLLKSYENSVVEIPCDGSIPENIKVNDDGIEFTDTFHYQIIKMQAPYAGLLPLACVFTSNDGDNIGITHNDPTTELPYANYFQKSSNFLFSSLEPTVIKLKGSITVLSDFRVTNTFFYLQTATSLSQPAVPGGTDDSHAIGLVTPYDPGPGGFFSGVHSQTRINGTVTYSINATISLAANENLFLMYFNNFQATPVTIIGGTFTMTFNSRYKASRIWGVTAYDLGKLIVQKINALSSNFLQTFNFGWNSNLLKSKLNLFVTSGDAARASTDPNYFQYYNLATINPSNPGNQDFTQFSSLGPVIKTTLSDFFDSFNPILNGSLSNQKLPGMPESLFFEAKKYVLDPSVITMSLDKIANFHVSAALDYIFNWLKVGYPAQDYDEKAGKYEYNTTFQWQAPIKSIIKTLELISKYRADSYGLEYTRYNTQGGKSSTFNDSDNSIFILNIDQTSSVADFFEALFISGVPDASSTANTDQKLIANTNYQPVYTDQLDGEYFTTDNDFSIFIFNQPSPATTGQINVTFDLLLNGLAGDGCTVSMWINGVLFQHWSGAVSSVNTPFSVVYNLSSHGFSKGDCIYFTIDTVRTCTVSISSFSITIGTGYWQANSTGDIQIAAGSTRQLVTLPIITATTVTVNGQQIPVVSYGFQYFSFLSAVNNTNFDWSVIIAGYVQGGTSNTTSFDIWLNGKMIGTISHPGTSALTQFNAARGIDLSGNITFSLYDLIWITSSATNLSAWIDYVDLKLVSTSIRAFNLNRPSVTGKSDNSAYSNIAGIPNPASAINLPDLTPGAMLRANASLLASTLFNLAPGALKYQTADKNSFLSKTLNGVTLSERADIDLHDLGDPLFLPFIFEFDTEVPINFADLLTNAANGHIEFIYNNKTFYGFPLQVTSKPAFNESQTWKLLCSPKTKLSDLVNLDWDGLVPLTIMDALVPIICPLHFIPLGYQKGPQYHNYSMDQDFYKSRIRAWVDQSDYYSPWQSNETVPFQFQSGGLSPATIQILDCNAKPVGSSVDITNILDPAIQPPQLLFQNEVSLAGLTGVFFMLLTIGIGSGTATFISEGIEIKDDWGEDTMRFDYTNSRNKLATIFTNGYAPCFRVHGQINRYSPKSKFTTFVDQPQDIDLLNAINYDTWKLEIGRGSGVPDYIMRKINFIMSLDTILIEGDQYTRDADAQWEMQTYPGEPKAYMTLDIRRAKNIEAITLNTSGQLDDEMMGGYTMDADAFGQSDSTGQNLIQVSGS